MNTEPLFSLKSDWEVTTLGEVTQRGGGSIQTGPFGSQLHASDYVENGIPSIMPQNISTDRISEEGIARITEADAKRLSKYRVRVGDIVYSRRGDVERRALVRQENDGWLCGTGCLKVSFGEGIVHPDYAAFYLSHPASKAWVVQHAVGATMPNLNTSILSALPFVLPPLKQQEAIASALGYLDDKIELNRRMNETLEEMARALFRDWFVDFGPTRRQMEGATDPIVIMGNAFPAEKAIKLAPLFPNRLNDDGLPEAWDKRGIYDFAKVVYGAPFKSKQFNTEGKGRPLARIRDLPKNEAGQFTEEIHKKEYLIHPGDVVVGMDGEFRSYLWYGAPTLMNQRICSFVPHASSNRALVWLAIKPLLRFFEETAIATTVIHLGKGDIDTFKIVAAGDDICSAFSTIVEPMASKIVANGQENQTLANMRDLLLPKLMSGEIRLKDVEVAL